MSQSPLLQPASRSHMPRGAVAVAVQAALLVLGSPVLAQKASPPPAPPTTLSLDARLVTLPMVVRDKKGALIQTLTKDDFVLKVDGHPQTIRYFDLDANLPLTLGLLVDTSQSQHGAIDEERTASTAFLDQMLTA